MGTTLFRIVLGLVGVIVTLTSGLFLFNLAGESSVIASLAAGAALLFIGARLVWKAVTGSGEWLEWMDARERQLLDHANAYHAGRRAPPPQTSEQKIQAVKDAIRDAQQERDV